MRKLIVVAAMAACLVTAPAHAGMTSYCQSPPFISTAAAPNVLLMIDTSGSMGYLAYSLDYTTSPATIIPYDSNKIYEGYFNPTKDYFLDGNNVYQEAPGNGTCGYQCGAANTSWTCSKNNSGSACYFSAGQGKYGCNNNQYACCSQTNLIAINCTGQNSGNYLNYKYMARIDLLRWAMTGGKPQGCSGGQIQECDPGTSYPNSQLMCDSTGCIMETNSTVNPNNVKVRVNVPWSRITGDEGGLLYQFKQLPVQPRIGSMYFSGSGVTNTVLIGDFTGSNNTADSVNPYKNTIAWLNSTTPGGSTPIGPALWAAYAYWAQNPPVYGGPQPDTGSGNHYKNPMYQFYASQGNAFVEVPCAKNFMILLTDGQWNTPSCTIDTGFEGSSSDPVVPAYWLHKTGFTNSVTNIKSNVEALYGVGLWLKGTGATSLENVAMYGGFDITSGKYPGGTNGYPSGTCDVDDCCSSFTDNCGKGSPCTSVPSPSFLDWDSDNNGLPDTFFGAGDALEIKQKIVTIINEILRRASAGTAVSVLSSSEGSGANLLQALFYPQRSFSFGNITTEVAWSSDLMNYWYYLDPFFKSSQIREDTIREDPTYTLLDLTQDYMLTFSFDTNQNKTMASRWVTPNAATVIPVENTLPIWRAGFDLWWTDPSARAIKTSVNGSSLISFDTTNAATLDPYLESTASLSAANTIINFTRGYDCVDTTGAACVCGTSGCSPIGRSRTITAGVCSARRSPCNSASDCPSGETCTGETHVWKLGDIISSTPRIMGPSPLNTFNKPVPFGYNDQTYDSFVKSTDYANRELAFVGANDGMLHAFWLGKLIQNWSGKLWYQIAKEEGTTGAGGMGTESYAFVPKNVLPYLQYLYDENYCHVYLVDGPITITEAAINKPSTCSSLLDYWDCPKLTTMQAAPNSGNVDFANTSWRSILIGSMGVGGATCDAASPDVNRISTPLSVSGSPTGWSSYFALDVTDQTNPKILWEFSNPDLGVTNLGPVIVKVGGNEKRCTNNSTTTCSTALDCGTGNCVKTNGRWFAILASGATGPITDKAFMGTSDKNLKLFVLDLKTGTLLRTIDTNIANAFAGSLGNSAIDLEKDKPGDSGNYQDDAVYIGYVQNGTSGGVLRLVINNDSNYANWTVSPVISNIGPVTTAVVNLLDRRNKHLWLYFGEGRYFYKQDDPATQRRLFGIQEPCFDAVSNSLSPSCSSTVALTDLQNQTTSPTTALTATQKGWYINLNPADSTMSAERVISNPTPNPLGAVYFVSFAPTASICGFGGTTNIWALDYKTGYKVTFAMQGKALVQVSTGEIKEFDLSSAFTENEGRKSVGILGIPPTGEGFAISSPPPPIKKFMHVQEQ